MSDTGYNESVGGIAIVGMAGRFPGANTIERFWQNLRNGVESISFFSDEELLAAGIDPELLARPNFVKARGVLEDIETFDTAFFGYSPREAEILDPQQRLFLECAWEALENAGYDPEGYSGLIGVYAGAQMSTYMISLYSNRALVETIGRYQIQMGNDNNFLTTRVSYKFNLRGPSLTVQTACSTSLVAVHLACQGLLNYECDMALAGGSSIEVPHKGGYFYQPGGIMSPDGHCRAFDDRAQGTVGGNGVGITVLKRLEDALKDHDCIHAIIRGSAVNNDGALKAGYAAPSVDGQAAVIAEALAMADVNPETISYVETHGTGTAVGDPIEVAGLTRAFRASTEKRNFCAIGSVKTNIGHLDQAAGVAGLIKTVLALKHRLLPPSLHFERPNPEIDFAASPFYVNTKLSEWKAGSTPRRAGVSSLGLGGTNAHVILEEAPAIEPSSSAKPWQLLVLSAKTSSALEAATENLAAYLKQNPDLNLGDVAYTLQVGRRVFDHRRMLVCHDLDAAVAALETRDPKRIYSTIQESENRSVAFMFPGWGAQHVNMALDLYQTDSTFREQVDYCSELFKTHLGIDLRHVLFPSEARTEEATQQLEQMSIGQPALFLIDYALAKLWMEWGIHPRAMIGHSTGEYVAACLAGVFSLRDAVALISSRGRLMETQTNGAALIAPLSEHVLHSFLNHRLSLAAINGPNLCVISGQRDDVEVLYRQLAKQGVESRLLHSSNAFHSHMMDPIIEPFIQQVERVTLNEPSIPFVSNVTGNWITAAEAKDPVYWARHLRQTVRFSGGIRELLKDPDLILLEVGPGQMLGSLARQHFAGTRTRSIISSSRHPREQRSDRAALLTALGHLWLAGVKIDWPKVYTREQRHRVPLCTYPFERKRFWIEPRRLAYESTSHQVSIQTGIDHEALGDGTRPDASDPGFLHARPLVASSYVPPQTELEQKIVGVWKEVLGIEQIGIHDNFLELGGHSLLATQLLARVYETLHVRLPLNRFLVAPTVADLAQCIEQARQGMPGSAAQCPLLAIQSKGSKLPFFCVHPVGGYVWCFKELARHLGSEQPFYGLQVLVDSAGQMLYTRVEDMAVAYNEALQDIRPSGPYILGGWSFGGLVAFEMACKLYKQGHEVALLALLDTPAPAMYNERTHLDDARLFAEVVRELAHFSGKNPPVSYADLVPLASDEQLDYVLEQTRRAAILPSDDEFQLRQYLHVVRTNYQAAHNYNPQVYPGRITLFRASQDSPQRSFALSTDPALGWAGFSLEPVDVCIVPGDHTTMLSDPHVDVLAERLKSLIGRNSDGRLSTHYPIRTNHEAAVQIIKPRGEMI